MIRTAGQLCLAIVSVLLAGSAADGQTESAPRQTSDLTTVLRNLWPLLAPSATGNAEGAAPAPARTNLADAVPAGEPPTVGRAETALDPIVARGKIEALLGRNCVACHGPNNPVVPQFVVTRFDLLARKDKDYLVADQPERSQILKRVEAGRMPPAQRPPLAEQEKRDLRSWINVALQQPPPPQLKGIVDTLRDDLGLTKLVELGEKAGVSKELQGGGPYTIFAPTNEAIERLNAQGGVPEELLWSLLLNHGIAGRRSSEQLERDGKVKSVGLQELKVQRKKDVLFIGEARVLTPDVACTNGVIHVVENLIWLPPRPGSGKPEAYVTRSGIVMVKIPEGEFLMGSPPAEIASLDANPDEGPQVRVTLSPFSLGKTEVTRDQYRTIMHEDPSFDKLAWTVWPAAAPVQTVTWISAAEFCNKLSEVEGLQPYYDIRNVRVKEGDMKVVTTPAPAGNGYRLPTEAEWEYACRAGNTGQYCFGTPPPQLLAQYAVFKQAGFPPPEGLKPLPVGNRLPNAWGLLDMHGNVQEWCQDWYGPYSSLPPGSGPRVNPKGPEKGDQKVYRGGSYLRPAKDCRSAVRLGGDVLGTQDDFRHEGVGFRVARTLKGVQVVPPSVSQGDARSKQ